ncbi:MAG TPA: hypothetical protein VET85_12795 [Stellaceae bacterium]|nr:hypothetical protein [Stellaceae bacterium]
MEETIEPRDDFAKQATNDRSVIDHLVKSFPTAEGERPAEAPLRERSADLYHRIRKSWTRAR